MNNLSTIFNMLISLAISGAIVLFFSKKSGMHRKINFIDKIKFKIFGYRVAKCPKRGFVLSFRGLSEEEIMYELDSKIDSLMVTSMSLIGLFSLLKTVAWATNVECLVAHCIPCFICTAYLYLDSRW